MKRFWRLMGENGGVPIVVAVTLSIISTLGLLTLRMPEAIDPYNASLRNIRNGEPINENMTYASDALGTLGDAAGGWPIPTDPGDVFQIGAVYMIEDMVRSSSQPIPDRQQGFGTSGQRAACNISVDRTLAKPGEQVTVTVKISKLFQSKISHITGGFGNEGFGLGNTGGSYVFRIPSGASGSILANYDAYERNGNIACSGAVTVQVGPAGTCSLGGTNYSFEVTWSHISKTNFNCLFHSTGKASCSSFCDWTLQGTNFRLYCEHMTTKAEYTGTVSAYPTCSIAGDVKRLDDPSITATFKAARF